MSIAWSGHTILSQVLKLIADAFILVPFQALEWIVSMSCRLEKRWEMVVL
jgi:hypothetical protein